jgi:hypothetical protein
MASAAYTFKFVADWDDAVFAAYSGANPGLEAAVRAVLDSMKKLHAAQPGILCMHQDVTHDGLTFKVYFAHDQTVAAQYLV